MATQIFDQADGQNARRAHAAWCADVTQTMMFDGAGRYAVGKLGAMEEDLNDFMAQDYWEWYEVDEEFYNRKYYNEER
jgi:hypothetical protein